MQTMLYKSSNCFLVFFILLTFLKNSILIMAMQKITLGAGCFWCVETAFRRLKGVQSAISGYSGGHTSNPTYEAVKNMFFIFTWNFKN